jgi:protein-tyrosine-phosphatase
MFVCTGNTCRSPMAEYLFRALAGEGFEGKIHSAGLFPAEGMAASPGAIQALAAKGIFLSGHRARMVSAALLAEADVVLAMTRGHKTELTRFFPEYTVKFFTLGEFIGRPEVEIKDPFGMPAAVYQQVAGELEELMRQIIEGVRERCE